MRNMMWIYTAIILLLSAARSLTSDIPNLVFNLGSDVNLTCSNKTWDDMFYVIWKIQLTYKQCQIDFNNDGRRNDSCKDGKSLRNTSSAVSYLHIPNFSNNDVGVYTCESAFHGGNKECKLKVDITVPPSTSAWLEHEGNKMVAVCKAEGGKPAANISWSHTGNTSSQTLPDPHGLITVESRLVLPEGMDTENLSCAIRHMYWKEEKTLVPVLSNKGYVLWLCVFTVVVIIVFLAGVLLYAQNKLMMLRRSQQSDTTSPSKSLTIEDVEEVEPYASYVQRVNSIYNSSAD